MSKDVDAAYLGKGVNGVVDTSVIWHEAAEHSAVGGIYNRVRFKRGDVAFPKIKIVPNRL